MDMWHTIIPCIVVIGLSPKDTRPHPNTLPIQSLPEVNFWVFHPRDPIPFLIRLTRAFTFHYYFFFHFMHFSQFLSFLHIIHKYHQHHINFQLVQISLKLQSYHNSIIFQQFYQKQPNKFPIIQISIKHNLYQNSIIFQQL